MGQLNGTDTAIIEELRNGNVAVFEALFQQYWQPLYKAAYKRLHNRTEAEDIAQEVLTSIWQRRTVLTIHENSSLGAYLFTALKYRIISFYARVQPERFQGEVLEMLLQMQTDDQYSQLITAELNQLLQQELSTMPANMQQAYRLTRMEDHTVKEAATILGLSEQTVKNLASTSGKQLRKVVERYYAGHSPQALCVLVIAVLDRFR